MGFPPTRTRALSAFPGRETERRQPETLKKTVRMREFIQNRAPFGLGILNLVLNLEMRNRNSLGMARDSWIDKMILSRLHWGSWIGSFRGHEAMKKQSSQVSRIAQANRMTHWPIGVFEQLEERTVLDADFHVVADMDGDGLFDVVGMDSTGATVDVRYGADYPDWCDWLLDTPSGTQSLSLDMDNNGVADQLLMDPIAGVLNVLMNQSTDEPFTLMRAAGLHRLAVNDFDRDGFMDLVVLNRVSRLLTLMFGGNLPGMGRPAQQLSLTNDPDSLLVGDTNSDGFDDILIGNYDSPDLSLILGKGDGSFGAEQRLHLGAVPLGLYWNSHAVPTMLPTNPDNPGGTGHSGDPDDPGASQDPDWTAQDDEELLEQQLASQWAGEGENAGSYSADGRATLGAALVGLDRSTFPTGEQAPVASRVSPSQARGLQSIPALSVRHDPNNPGTLEAHFTAYPHATNAGGQTQPSTPSGIAHSPELVLADLGLVEPDVTPTLPVLEPVGETDVLENSKNPDVSGLATTFANPDQSANTERTLVSIPNVSDESAAPPSICWESLSSENSQRYGWYFIVLALSAMISTSFWRCGNRSSG